MDGLSKEDYSQLPDTTRAYQGVAQNNFLSITPSVLRFSHDDPCTHLAELIVWNKTKNALDYSVVEPKSKYFEIFRGKSRLFAGTQDTIIVKCKPYDQKLFYDSIKIQVTSECDDPIVIPLEIMPNPNWFTLPKVIILPKISIGQRFELVLPLPKPPNSEKNFHFFTTSTTKDVINIEPSEGILPKSIGCTSTIPKANESSQINLTISYCPRDFASTNCTISVHFPEISLRPYTITVLGKCLPGLFGEEIRQTIAHYESVVVPKVAKKYPSFKLCVKDEGFHYRKDRILSAELYTRPNLSTPAAVMKFLCQPTKESSGQMGPLGISVHEAYSNYKTKEKEFRDKLVKLEIDEQAFRIQHARAVLGMDPIDSISDISEAIRVEREKEQFEYEALMGSKENDLRDIGRMKVHSMNIPQIRDLDSNKIISTKYKQLIPAEPPVYLHSYHGDQERRTATQKWARREILRPFFQAAFIIMTRYRADKRIVKLRVLIKNTRAYQTKNLRKSMLKKK